MLREELPAALQALDVEFNLPRELTTADIAEIRGKTIEEVLRVMLDDSRDSFPPSQGSMPFGEPIVEKATESERENLRVEWIKQLIVSLRYVDQLLEIDEQICGDKNTDSPGIRLPVYHVRKRGSHQVELLTHNAWGSTDYRDPALQLQLRKQFTSVSTDGILQFDSDGYHAALNSFLASPPDTSADLAVLGEEDRVDIFDADGKFVSQGVVSDVSGGTVLLNLHGNIVPKEGFSMRKKSDRRSILKYKQYVHSMMQRLEIDTMVVDRNGQQYEWEERKKRRGNEYDSYEEEGLSEVEAAFFHTNTFATDSKINYDVQYDRGIGQRDIPIALLSDSEQAVAFALGGMEHPCMVIQGPPGTGKTTVASHLAKYFQEQGKKTLILSHSNRGLDVLLKAIKKHGVNVHRGGTESRVCDQELQENFIRKNLKHPRKSDYTFMRVDAVAFRKAKEKWNAETGLPEPTEADFRSPMLDKDLWKDAWEAFDREKKQIATELECDRRLVAGVTLNSLISDEILELIHFDVVIVDEASKAHLHEFLPALEKAGKQIIFIGDHKQLGNIDIPRGVKNFLQDSKASEHSFIDETAVEDFEKGPFEMMAEKGALAKVMLRTNRRSLPGIVELVSKAGYDGRLKAGRIDEDHPENIGQLLWVDTKSREGREEQSAGTSKVNKLEARLVARRLLREHRKEKKVRGETGVITMYRPQGKLVRKNLRKLRTEDEGEKVELMNALRGNIATVDSFQGSERKDIHILTTRSNDRDAVGFLQNVSRVNVAFSRAQDSMTVYGDSRTLIEGNPDQRSAAYFQIAHETCRKLGRVIDLSESVRPEIQKSQTHSAKRQRARRSRRRMMKNAAAMD